MSLEEQDYAARFSGMGRLYSEQGQAALKAAHVGVVGVGGVGSWAVEALARSGIGRLTLIDLDDVCISNVNRQLPAMTGHFGQPKVDVLAERAAAINPRCDIRPVREFVTASNVERLLTGDLTCVLDAIDGAAAKCVMIVHCREKGLPIVTAGSAGGRRDPTAIEVADLTRVTHDRLLQRVRKQLRARHGFPRDTRRKFKVDSVFSREAPVFPRSNGEVCATKEADSDLRLDCNSGYGTATFVTGAFGFVAASRIVAKIAAEG